MAITPVVGAGYIPAVQDLATKINAGGATVPAATTTTAGVVKQAEAQADSVATDVPGLLADFNALLTKLRAAGIQAV